MKRFFKIFLSTIAGILVFLLLLVVVTQTQFFRDRLRAAALSNLNSLLDAEVSLGELRGNLVTGFSIDSISISVGNSPFLRADRADLQYNLLEIPGRTISVRSISIIHPYIRLVRSRGERWNFERMLRPSAPDTVSSSPMDWVVRLDRLEIRQGRITLVDSASLSEPGHQSAMGNEVEFHSFDLRDVNLVASADIRAKEKSAKITSMSFVSMTPEFELRMLAGKFTVNQSGAQVRDLVIRTSRSNLAIDASMSKVDLLGGIALENLRRCPVSLALRADSLDLDELKMFLPPLEFLNGRIEVNLAATGEFGELAVQHLDVRFGRSSLSLKGSVLNLHDPADLSLDVRILESSIEPGDPLALMPSFNLPDYRGMGTIHFTDHFQGRPVNFHSKGMLETDGESVESDFDLAIGGPATLMYKGYVGVHGLNLARLLDDSTMESKLNGVVRFEGEGVSLATLRSTMSIDLDSSLFRGQPLRDTHVKLSGADRSIQAKSFLRFGSMTANLTTGISQEEEQLPSFSVNGEIRSLHLGRLLHDDENDHLVSVRIRARGTGLTPRAVSGDLDLDYSSWRESDSSETSGNLHLEMDQSDSLRRSINIESTLGSLSLQGAFDLPSMVRVVGFNAQNISTAVRKRFAFLDSARTGAQEALVPWQGIGFTSPTGYLNARFTVHIEDLEPLTVFIPSWDGFGQATFSGTISGGPSETSMSGKLSVDEFAYGRVEGGILIEGGSVEFSLLHMRPSRPLDTLNAEVHGTVRSLHINKNEFDSVRVNLVYRADSALYSAGTTLNGDVHLRAAGTSRLDEDTVAARFDTLAWSYLDYAWESLPGAMLRIGSAGTSISNVVMRRDTQEVRLDAALGPGGALSAILLGRRLDLDGLRYLMSKEDVSALGRVFDGVGEISLHASGTADRPVMSASLSADGLAYRTVPFGLLRGTFLYRDRLLSMQVSVDEHERRRRTTPVLVISGTVPVDLGFRNVQERVADEPMDLSIRSDSMEIGILDPLLPTFDQLSGTLTCNVNVRGTPKRPQYDGIIDIKGSSFLFVPNNIVYRFDGTFKPQGERITVVDAVVRNVLADETAGLQGEVHLAGDLSLADLKPGDFNLMASGKLLVVKETTAKSALSVYGRLFVEIGSSGLHFTGSIDHSLLKGDLLVRNSVLIFPPTRSARQGQAELSVPILPLDDTTRTETQAHPVSARYFGGNGSAQRSADAQAVLPTKSFMDGVRYDLDIETSGGNTEIRMIFNPGEELDATIEGRFSITEDGQKWFGDLTIARATYNFLKRFKAEGTINFTGDLMNPGIDISATYEGTRKIRDTVSTMTEMSENVVVTIRITGTRYAPKLALSMKIDDQDYITYANAPGHTGLTSNDVQSDAIQFILYGTFPLTASQKNDVANDVRSTVGTSILTGASSMFTGALSDYLRTQTGFINSVELSYGSGDNLGQRTDIRLSGSAFSGFWRYGGRILNDPLSNANFSLLYSFGTIFNDPALRNLMFELERRIQDVTIGQINISRGVNSARLFYRFSF